MEIYTATQKGNLPSAQILGQGNTNKFSITVLWMKQLSKSIQEHIPNKMTIFVSLKLLNLFLTQKRSDIQAESNSNWF